MLSPVESFKLALDSELRRASGNPGYLDVIRDYEKSVIRDGFLKETPDRYIILLRDFQKGVFYRNFPDFGMFRKQHGKNQVSMTGMTSVLFSFPLEGLKNADHSFLFLFLSGIRKNRGGINRMKLVSQEILEHADLTELEDEFYQAILLFYMAITVNQDQPDEQTAADSFRIVPFIRTNIYPDIIEGLRTKIDDYFEKALKSISNLMNVYSYPLSPEELYLILGCQAECFFRSGDMEDAIQSYEKLKEEPVKILDVIAGSMCVDVSLLMEKMDRPSFHYNAGIGLRERKFIGHVPAFILATRHTRNPKLQKLSQCSVGTGLLDYIELYNIPELIPEADQALMAALTLEDNDYVIYSGLAVLRMLQENQQAAIAYAMKALKMNPDATGAMRVMLKYCP